MRVAAQCEMNWTPHIDLLDPDSWACGLGRNRVVRIGLVEAVPFVRAVARLIIARVQLLKRAIYGMRYEPSREYLYDTRRR